MKVEKKDPEPMWALPLYLNTVTNNTIPELYHKD